MMEKSSVYEVKITSPRETIATFTIILDKDWMKSPDVIEKVPGTYSDISRCGELKFFNGNEELDPDDPNLWDKVDSSVWIEAYKSTADMPDYIRDIYTKNDRFKVNDNISEANRGSISENRISRVNSYPLHPSQVYLAKRKTKFGRACSYLRSILGNIFHTRKKSIQLYDSSPR